jgi:hypothetical protein
MPEHAASKWAWWTNALLLTVVTGGLVWAVTAGDRQSGAYWAMGFWFLLGGWVVPRSTPDTATGALVLIALGCAASAVIFFCLYQWASWPGLAYLEGITFGVFALHAVFALCVKRLRLRPVPADTEATGVQGQAP